MSTPKHTPPILELIRLVESIQLDYVSMQADTDLPEKDQRTRGNFYAMEIAKASERLDDLLPLVVNSHAALVEACKLALDSFGGVRPEDYAVASQREFDTLTAALALAEGQL